MIIAVIIVMCCPSTINEPKVFFYIQGYCRVMAGATLEEDLHENLDVYVNLICVIRSIMSWKSSSQSQPQFKNAK